MPSPHSEGTVRNSPRKRLNKKHKFFCCTTCKYHNLFNSTIPSQIRKKITKQKTWTSTTITDKIMQVGWHLILDDETPCDNRDLRKNGLNPKHAEFVPTIFRRRSHEPRRTDHFGYLELSICEVWWGCWIFEKVSQIQLFDFFAVFQTIV